MKDRLLEEMKDCLLKETKINRKLLQDMTMHE
jgi:hypothetical protein